MNKAFTLIELIISIGILAILAGVGFINIVNYKHRQDLTSTTQEIIEVVRNAQNRSLSQEATSTAGTGGRWGVYFENPTGAGNDFYDLFKAQVMSVVRLSQSRSCLLISNLTFQLPAQVPL